MMGTVKSQLRPHSRFSFWPQLIVGGVVSTVVTVWLQLVWLPQQSVACQVRVMSIEQSAPAVALVVSLPTTTTVTFVPQQRSFAVGSSNVHVLSHSTVLLVAQVSTGGAVSATVTVWKQVTLL